MQRPIIAILLVLVAACAPPPSDPGMGSIQVEAFAGPVCPVETEPPDPACAPRAVEGALVVVQPADGRDIVVAQGQTDAEGRLLLDVPPGRYLVFGAAVEGAMGLPPPVTVAVEAEGRTLVGLEYDTGVR